MPRPKPSPTERFQLSCEVEATQLGGAVAHFTKMGLRNIHFELITDIKTFRNNTRKDEAQLIVPNQTAEQILLPWLKDHPTFKAKEAAVHLEANGSTSAAAYPALKVLVTKKVLKALGGGNYTRTDVKHLAAPKKHAAKKAAKAAKPAKVAKKKKVVFDVPHGEAILRIARRGHGKTTFENIKKHFESEGRNVASIHPTIKDLVGKKQLKRNGNATYELITAKPTETNTNTENVSEASHG